MVSMAERRQHTRSRIDWPVSVYHPRLGMFINGRSVDVSQSGAKITLPLAVPVRPGQVVELNFPRTTTLARLAGSFSRIKTARVVRVEPEPSPKPQQGQAPAYSDSHAPVSPCATAAPAKTRRASRQFVAVHFDRSALEE